MKCKTFITFENQRYLNFNAFYAYLLYTIISISEMLIYKSIICIQHLFSIFLIMIHYNNQ